MKLLFLLAFLSALNNIAFADTQRQLVKLGVIAPLTGSFTVYGSDVRRSIPILEAQLNQSSTQYTFKIIIEDGRCGVGNAAITAAQKLINVNGVEFLSVGCSGEILQVGPLAQRSGVLATCYACSHPDVKNLGDRIFRTYVDIENGVSTMAELLNRELPGELTGELSGELSGKLVILTEENAFTIGIHELLEKELGDKIGYTEQFAVDDTDFNTMLVKARSTNPAAYYLNAASPRTYQTLFKQLRALGIKEPVYSYHMPGDKDSLKLLGWRQNGVRYIEVPEVSNSSADFQEFYQNFLTAYPEGADLEFLLRSGYDSLASYAKAIEKVGPKPEAVKQFFQSNSWSGALGTIKFDEKGDVIGLNFVLKEIVDGRPQPVL